jgi:hypothetical protein
MGIEPTTYSLGSCRSTTELRPQCAVPRCAGTVEVLLGTLEPRRRTHYQNAAQSETAFCRSAARGLT